jgi:hypothetical protein
MKGYHESFSYIDQRPLGLFLLECVKKVRFLNERLITIKRTFTRKTAMRFFQLRFFIFIPSLNIGWLIVKNY